MPVYNGEPYIHEAIESILKQLLPEWELLISDDGSKDGTIDYLKSLDDPRIFIFTQKRFSHRIRASRRATFLATSFTAHPNASLAMPFCSA